MNFIFEPWRTPPQTVVTLFPPLWWTGGLVLHFMAAVTYSESIFALGKAHRGFPARPMAVILAAILAVFAPKGARAGAPDARFDRSKMEAVELNGLQVWLGAPVRVTSQLGWQTVWRHDAGDPEGTFIHLTPVMAKFPGGNLIATYAMDPDGQDDPITISAFQISRDGGRDWGRRYSVLMQHNPMIFIPGEDDRISQFSHKGRTVWQTSSYTGLVGLENNRMLVCYDRDPEELPAGPDDRSGIFVVPVELEKR